MKKSFNSGIFAKQQAKSGLTRDMATAAKAKETRKRVSFVSDEILFLLAACLAGIFCKKPFFFAGCSKEPRMPRTLVIDTAYGSLDFFFTGI